MIRVYRQISSPSLTPLSALSCTRLGLVYTMNLRILVHCKHDTKLTHDPRPALSQQTSSGSTHTHDGVAELDEPLRVLRGTLGGGEGGVEDVERSDGQLAGNLGREEEAAAEGLSGKRRTEHSIKITLYMIVTHLVSRSLTLLMDLSSSSVIWLGCSAMVAAAASCTTTIVATRSSGLMATLLISLAEHNNVYVT